MKFITSIFLFAAIFFLNSFFVSAQTSTDSAVIKFDNEVLDFGKVKRGEPVTVEFKFTNTGNKPLVVSEAQRGCGCTSVRWTQEPVMPNAQGSVWATFNSSVGHGHIMKPIHIHSNATKPQLDIYIQGELLDENFVTDSLLQK